jgi:hypothetical protein
LYAENLEFLFGRLIELKELLSSEDPAMNVQRKLKVAHEQIDHMERSAFWRLRNHWHRLKGAMG